MSVFLTLMAVIKFVTIQWDHFNAAAIEDTDSILTEELALVGSQCVSGRERERRYQI